MLEMAGWVIGGQVQTSAFWWAGWLTDPVLAVSGILAVLVYRASVAMRDGLLSRCWAAYAAGITLTLLGNLGLWFFDTWRLPPSAVWPFWLAWHPAACALALAPVYQFEAIRCARRRASSIASPQT
jgi:hypothetical protein